MKIKPHPALRGFLAKGVRPQVVQHVHNQAMMKAQQVYNHALAQHAIQKRLARGR